MGNRAKLEEGEGGFRVRVSVRTGYQIYLCETLKQAQKLMALFNEELRGKPMPQPSATDRLLGRVEGIPSSSW